jgi:hypothetical protein
MFGVLIRSLIFGALAAVASHFVRSYLHTELFLSDVSPLSAFLTVFGTLYGILAAFVVFEVWTQFNRISELIDQEAQGLERLYGLVMYFKDESLTLRMKDAITAYAQMVINGKFQSLAVGRRNQNNGSAFRKISEVILSIEFDDDHDSIVFDQLLEHYGKLGQVRTERRNQSLARLPFLLKAFIYVSSAFALMVFLVMPFENAYYAYFSSLVIAFVLAMVFQMVEDLDNPFAGYLRLTPEPFERALKHIEEDY